MRRLICNVCSIALGALAAIMAFMPIFDTVTIISDNWTWFDKAFSLFTNPDELSIIAFTDYDATFKTVSHIIAGIMMCIVVIILFLATADMLNGKKSGTAGMKRILGLILFLLAIAFVVTVIIYLNAHSVTALQITTKLAITNWFEFLAIPVGFGLSGLFALAADAK